MRKDCRIREALNIPREENVHSVGRFRSPGGDLPAVGGQEKEGSQGR